MTIERIFQSRISGIQAELTARDLSALLLYKVPGVNYPYGGIGYVRFVLAPLTSVPPGPIFVVVPVTGAVTYIRPEGLGASYMDESVSGLRLLADVPMTGMTRERATDLVYRVREVAHEAGISRARLAVALISELPVWAAQTLEDALPGAEFVDGTDILDGLMISKSSNDVAAVARAAAAADHAFESVFATMRCGVTELEIAAEAQCEAGRSGAAFSDVRVATGKPGDVRWGVRPSTRKVVESGDHIHVSLDVIVDGYWANVVRRGVMGKASPEHRTAFDVALAMHNAAIEAMRIGTTGEEVFAAAAAVASKAKAARLIPDYRCQRFGHGIGLEAQERPFLVPGEKTALQKNTTVSLHPGMLVPGVAQVAVGNSVVVTRDGARVLSRFPAELQEVRRG